MSLQRLILVRMRPRQPGGIGALTDPLRAELPTRSHRGELIALLTEMDLSRTGRSTAGV
jgi:hypothetical protein